VQTRLRSLVISLILPPLAACGQSDRAAKQQAIKERFDLGLKALQQSNYAEAYCYWRPLAERGYADAQYRLGWFYANGHGMPVNVKTAVAWWTKAAKQGHVDAQLALGLAYTNGDGIPRDLEKAVLWYLAAANNGQEDARDILRKMVSKSDAVVEPHMAELARAGWLTTRRKIGASSVNVRSGPNTDHKVVATLKAGEEVRVLRTVSAWSQIVLDNQGNTAWVLEKLLE
jgi:SH3-like domain-containing protein